MIGVYTNFIFDLQRNYKDCTIIIICLPSNFGLTSTFPTSEVSFIIELQDNEGDVPSPTPKDLINFHQPPRHVTRRRMHTVLLSSFTYLLKFNK